MKIYRRTGTLAMIGILILVTIAFASITKYDESGYLFGAPTKQNNWQTELQQQITHDKQSLQEEDLPKPYLDSLKEQIALNQYRLDHDISPNEGTLWGFMVNTDSLTALIVLFTIIVASISVAGEFTWGTIKLLMIRSSTRSKILLSKYLATLGFAVSMLIVLFLFSLTCGALLYGVGNLSSPYLVYEHGGVVEKSMVLHIFTLYGLRCVSLLMMVTFAFMISTVFRSSSLAIGLSIFLTFTGNTIVGILSGMNVSWAKYILFANIDLTPYFQGSAPLEGMSLSFSIIVLSIYYLIFMALTWILFNKRDIVSGD